MFPLFYVILVMQGQRGADSQMLLSAYSTAKSLLGITELSMLMAVTDPVRDEPEWPDCVII